MKHKTTIMPFLTAAILLVTALAACAPNSISLANTNWKVTEINGKPVLENSEVTMQFTTEQAGGKASCNNYFTAYTLDGDKLTFGPAGSTLMYCQDEDIMEQEALFLTSLEKVEKVSILGSEMTLTLNDGGSLVLVKK